MNKEGMIAAKIYVGRSCLHKTLSVNMLSTLPGDVQRNYFFFLRVTDSFAASIPVGGEMADPRDIIIVIHYCGRGYKPARHLNSRARR